jgi:uncharacterized protein
LVVHVALLLEPKYSEMGTTITDMALTEEALIREAGRWLNAAVPGADIILFGSRARGDARPNSDLDLLVIEPNFAYRGEEYGRLRKELRGLEVAIDLVIYRRREADEWGGVPGSFLHRVLGEGRVLSAAREPSYPQDDER